MSALVRQLNQPLELRIHKSVAKYLRKCEPDLARRCALTIQALGTDPHPPGARQLQAQEPFYRLRIGSYRIIYARDNNLLFIAHIAHRNEVYAEFKRLHESREEEFKLLLLECDTAIGNK